MGRHPAGQLSGRLACRLSGPTELAGSIAEPGVSLASRIGRRSRLVRLSSSLGRTSRRGLILSPRSHSVPHGLLADPYRLLVPALPAVELLLGLPDLLRIPRRLYSPEVPAGLNQRLAGLSGRLRCGLTNRLAGSLVAIAGSLERPTVGREIRLGSREGLPTLLEPRGGSPLDQSFVAGICCRPERSPVSLIPSPDGFTCDLPLLSRPLCQLDPPSAGLSCLTSVATGQSDGTADIGKCRSGLLPLFPR